jgi:hypothetical protein
MTEPLQLLLHIRYKEGQERYERVTLAPEFLDMLRQKLILSEHIREVMIYEGPIFRHHKSYAEDFSPEALEKAAAEFLKFAEDAKTIREPKI